MRRKKPMAMCKLTMSEVRVSATIESPTPLTDEVVEKVRAISSISEAVLDVSTLSCIITCSTVEEVKSVIGTVARMIPGVPIKWSTIESIAQ